MTKHLDTPVGSTHLTTAGFTQKSNFSVLNTPRSKHMLNTDLGRLRPTPRTHEQPGYDSQEDELNPIEFYRGSVDAPPVSNMEEITEPGEVYLEAFCADVKPSASLWRTTECAGCPGATPVKSDAPT